MELLRIFYQQKMDVKKFQSFVYLCSILGIKVESGEEKIIHCRGK